ESAHADPFSVADRRQLFEDGRTSLRIVARDDFAARLVVDENARPRLGETHLDELAVDAYFVARTDLLPDFRWHPVHGDASGDDHLLHRAARSESARRQHLVQALRLVEDFVSGAFVLRRR